MLHLVYALETRCSGRSSWGRWRRHWFWLHYRRGRRGLLVVDLFLFIFVLQALQVLLLEVASDLRRHTELAGKIIIGVKLGIAFVNFGDDLKV